MGQRNAILVVDDDPDVRECLRAALAQVGYGVEMARDGGDALARLAAAPVDLVLSDFQMPGMNGLDLICGMRARGHATPVLLLTGAETRDMCTAATRYGAAACMSKPVDLDDLVWTIELTLACHGALVLPRIRRLTPQVARW